MKAIKNLQPKLAGWRPREELMLQLSAKSAGSIIAQDKSVLLR